MNYTRDSPSTSGDTRKRLHAQTSQIASALERAWELDGGSCSGVGLDAASWVASIHRSLGQQSSVSNIELEYWIPRSVQARGRMDVLLLAIDIVDPVTDPWCSRSAYGYSNSIRLRSNTRAVRERSRNWGRTAGAVVAGAMIRIVEGATGQTHTLRAGADGRFC